MEKGRLRLSRPHLPRDEEPLQIGFQRGAHQPGVLHPGHAVGGQGQAAARRPQGAAQFLRPREEQGTLPQVVQIPAVHLRRVGPPAQALPQAAEPLHREEALLRLPPVEGRPEGVVDLQIGLFGLLVPGPAELRQHGVQGPGLGGVEVEEGVVGVQQDDVVAPHGSPPPFDRRRCWSMFCIRTREETTSTPTARDPAMLRVWSPVVRKSWVSPRRAASIML